MLELVGEELQAVKAALHRIVSLSGQHCSGRVSRAIERIVTECDGDLRSAILSLQCELTTTASTVDDAQFAAPIPRGHSFSVRSGPGSNGAAAAGKHHVGSAAVTSRTSVIDLCDSDSEGRAGDGRHQVEVDANSDIDSVDEVIGNGEHPVSVTSAELAWSFRGQLRLKPDPDEEDTTAGLTCGRDAHYSLFHAVGKILHAKADLTWTVEHVLDRCEGTPGTVLDFVQENYLGHMPNQERGAQGSDAAIAEIPLEASASIMGSLEDLSEAFSAADLLREGSWAHQSNPHVVLEAAAVAMGCRAYIAHHLHAAAVIQDALMPHTAPAKVSSKCLRWLVVVFDC